MTDKPVLPPGAERSDILVLVWRLIAAGREDEARERLIYLWSAFHDAAASRREGRVAVRLFQRLGFTTDDPEGWNALPDPVPVHRVGPNGIAWTVDREVAERRARVERTRIRTGTVPKNHVLAYITWYSEAEVVVRPGSVTSND